MMEKTNLQRECWEQVRKAKISIDLILRDRSHEKITEVQTFLQIYEQNRKIDGALNLLQKEGL